MFTNYTLNPAAADKAKSVASIYSPDQSKDFVPVSNDFSGFFVISNTF
jgi:hypothetical protein